MSVGIWLSGDYEKVMCCLWWREGEG